MSLLRLVLPLTCLSCADVWGTTQARNYVYQKDVSEQCRRRVVPSVFLGRRVVEAHSQVLDFYRMELPYNCFISIRAESGNSIVLVVQLQSEENLSRACAEGSSQLVVYEIGETFGGYWGPLPDSVMRQTPAEPSGPVTRKTTPDTHYDDESAAQTVSETTTTSEQQQEGRNEGAGEDFIRVEVPIVDVVREEVDDPVGANQPPVIDPDENFDFLYDVTPKRGGEYQSKILPVVQFSIRRDDGRRGEDPRFDLDLEPHTPDERLTFYGERSTKRPKAAPVTNSYVNRLMKFKQSKLTPRTVKKTFKLFRNTHQDVSTINDFKKSSLSTRSGLSYSNSLDVYDRNNVLVEKKYDSRINVDKHQSEKHVDLNQSVNNINVARTFNALSRTSLSFNYVTKNIYHFHRRKPVNPKFKFKDVSTNTNFKKQNITKKDIIENNNKSFENAPSSAAKATYFGSDTQTRESIQVASKDNLSISDVSRNRNESQVVTNETTSKLSGSLVGHESWENVVKVAPEMAVLLNKTVKTSTHTTIDEIVQGITSVSKRKEIRKKRSIKVIPIENARPHGLTTRTLEASTSAATFGYSDMEEFAQLVELQDDELHDRVALRYFRQYVGPALFNLCTNRESKAKHIFLFNSSRVVMAITNFTLQRMTVILTPARTLVGGAMCSRDSLECQVYGTRICIDTLNACDGVPNCGAYDIYDEDRVLCGETGGLLHTVSLAAVASLALLLIAMYAVHYWLKRCLPRVSEAFFIYTNGAENVLYLETVMRSPHAVDDITKEMLHRRRSSNDSYFNPDSARGCNNAMRRILRACFNFCKCKRKRNQMPDLDFGDLCANYEVELNKTTMCQTERTDAGIQTGDSLEMAHINVLGIKDSIELRPVSSLDISNRLTEKVSVSIATSDEDVQKHADELNMLKFFKDARSPVPSTSRDVQHSQRRKRLDSIEEELETHTYDPPQPKYDKISTTYKVPIDKPSSSKHVVKLLRFDEEPTEIPRLDDVAGIQQSNIELEDQKKKDHSDKSESTSREYGFWKSKKSKKKAHLSIR